MSKVKFYLAFIRALLPSVYICFKYLPFKQALKLPIWIYKPHDCLFKGAIRIESEEITKGMICLGFYTAEQYSNSGISLRIEGTIVFKGKCHIGNDTYVMVGKEGNLVFEDDFKTNSGTRIACMTGIHFGKHVLLGWECTVTDSHFHRLYDREEQVFKKGYEQIDIADNNWFAMNCLIMPGVQTPEHCIFAARTILTKGGHYESYCVHGGNPIRILSRNVERIAGQDNIAEYI